MRKFLGPLLGLALAFVAAPSLAATLYISEFASPVGQVGTVQAQVFPQPAVTDQIVSITGASVQSAAFNTLTHAIQVECDADCSISIGTNPTATTTNFLMGDGIPYQFVVLPGQKIAVISNTSGGSGSDVNIVAVGGNAVAATIPVGGYEFNASVIPTVQAGSYAAGQSLGGLQTISIGSTAGLSGILTQITLGSKGGSTVNLLAYVWSKNPSSTTCTDKTNFVVNATDNQSLIVSPQSITPALAVSAQDTSTYGSAANLVGPFVNGSANTNLYLCVLANASVTPGTTTDLRFNLSGIKDQP